MTRLAQQRIHRAHQRAGVTIVDPASTLIDANVAIGADTTIEPVELPARRARGSARAAAIGPLSTVIDSVLGDGVTRPPLLPRRRDRRATASRSARSPTCARRRSCSENAKAGTFVEIKNSTVGAGAKVPHLSYVGDADIGEGSNLGAGTITANYDGREQAPHDDRRAASAISVDTSLVAPVTVGDDAYTAAGSVITEDVPPGALGVARAAPDEHRGLRRAAPGAKGHDRNCGRRRSRRRRLGLHWPGK